jgi:hypothetical protein
LTWIEARVIGEMPASRARAPPSGSRHQHGRQPDQHRHHERGERGASSGRSRPVLRRSLQGRGDEARPTAQRQPPPR